MSIDILNANEARQKAITTISQEIEEQLSRVAKAINKAIENGICNTYVGIYAKPKTIQILNEKGYATKQYDDQRDGSSLFIEW